MNLNASISFKDLNVQYFWRTRRYLSLAILLGLLAVVVFAYIFSQQLPRVLEEASNVDSEKKLLTALRQKVAALQDSAFVEQAESREQIDTLLPSKKPLLQLLNNVGVAARDSQVSLTSVETTPGRIATGSAQLQTDVAQVVSSAPDAKINGVNVLAIGLTVRGSLAQINAFVKNLEQITPITDITQFQLTPINTGKAETDAFGVELKIASYYFTQQINLSVDAVLPQARASEQAFLNNLSTFKFAPEAAQSTIQGGGLNDLFKGF